MPRLNPHRRRRHGLCVRPVLRMLAWCTRRGLSAVMAVCCLLYVTSMFSLSGSRHVLVNTVPTGGGRLHRARRVFSPPPVTFPSLNTSMERKAVLILSQLRIDAEVVGEIFSQQAGLFYFPEYLWSFVYADPFSDSLFEKGALSTGHNDNNQFLNETRRNQTWAALSVTLRALFRCEFEKFFNRDDSELSEDGVPSSVAKDMFCREIQKNAPLRESFSCQGSPAEIVRRMTSLCVAKETVAVMVTGITHLKYLQSLVEDASMEVKVIEVVHDPRAVLVSWMNAVPQKRAGNAERRGFFDTRGGLALTATEMAGMCVGMVTNLMYWANSRRPFRTNYAVLRYEDLRADPHASAENVLSFLGVRPGNAAALRRVTDRIDRRIEDVKDDNVDWRQNLTVAGATKIQGRCSHAIRKFGYRLVKSERDLTDNRTSLVGTLPKDVPGLRDRSRLISTSPLPSNETLLLRKSNVQTVVHFRFQSDERGTRR